MSNIEDLGKMWGKAADEVPDLTGLLECIDTVREQMGLKNYGWGKNSDLQQTICQALAFKEFETVPDHLWKFMNRHSVVGMFLPLIQGAEQTKNSILILSIHSYRNRVMKQMNRKPHFIDARGDRV